VAAEQVHLAQARYNEALAKELIEKYGDWAITVAFYAAVHYVEAKFATRRMHTGYDEGHGVRANRLRDVSSLECFQAYKNLRTASNHVRYLELWEERGERLAHEYYSEENVRQFVEQDLVIVKQELDYQ
jgi:hypothetical protein